MVLLIARRYAVTPELARSLTFETAALFRVMVAVGALVLLHNLYAGAAATSRQILRWSAAALAGLWAFDLNYFTIAYLMGAARRTADPARHWRLRSSPYPSPSASMRNSADLEFRPSRAVTFRFLSLLLIGGYLAS